jgi:hypothetical protein
MQKSKSTKSSRGKSGGFDTLGPIARGKLLERMSYLTPLYAVKKVALDLHSLVCQYRSDVPRATAEAGILAVLKILNYAIECPRFSKLMVPVAPARQRGFASVKLTRKTPPAGADQLLDALNELGEYFWEDCGYLAGDMVEAGIITDKERRNLESMFEEISEGVKNAGLMLDMANFRLLTKRAK